MLQDDFDKLMEYFEQINQGKVVDLELVLQIYFKFMEDIKEAIQTSSDEDRADLFKKLMTMYTQILRESKKVTEKTGMTEEQLSSFASNPSNFSEDTWRMLQEARKKMADASKGLSDSIAYRRQASLEKKEGEGGEKPKPGKPSGEKRPKSNPKDKWLKS